MEKYIVKEHNNNNCFYILHAFPNEMFKAQWFITDAKNENKEPIKGAIYESIVLSSETIIDNNQDEQYIYCEYYDKTNMLQKTELVQLHRNFDQAVTTNSFDMISHIDENGDFIEKTDEIIKNCSNCHKYTTNPRINCATQGEYVCKNHVLTQEQPLVYIASALRGNIERNLLRAGKYTKRALHSRVLPITPHLNWASILDDTVLEDRKLGMNVGAKILLRCDAVWVFGKLSGGVNAEINLAMEHNIPVYLIDMENRAHYIGYPATRLSISKTETKE